MNNNYIISIPTDLRQIESELFFGLTKRQAIGFGIGIAMGIVAFILLKNINLDVAMYGLFFTSAPILFATIYKKDNMYVEQLIKLLLEQRYLNPNKRFYKITRKNVRLAKERGLITENMIKKQQPRKKELKPAKIEDNTKKERSSTK